MGKRERIIFLGTQSFPFGMAEVEKQTLIARALVIQGCEVTFVCNKSFNYKSGIPYKGIFKEVKYIYTSFTASRNTNRFINRVLWILGSFVEIFYLLFADYDCAILNSRSYAEILKYSNILHLRTKKLFLTFTEDFRSMHPNADKKMLARINDFENKTWNKIDGVFPISEELIRQVKEKNADLPMLKIPVLVDLADAENYIKPFDIPEEGYFLFCGSADYIDTIEFIIRGFEKADLDSFLYLVINGSPKNMQRISDRIKISSKYQNIKIKSDLPKDELWGFYKFATALLIPLNFDQRDKARFPHKIGEYCASGAAIITSKWGEIPIYFTDGENCIMLSSSEIDEFAQKLTYIRKNKSLQIQLIKGAFKLANREFNFMEYSKVIFEFIEEVNHKQKKQN